MSQPFRLFVYSLSHSLRKDLEIFQGYVQSFKGYAFLSQIPSPNILLRTLSFCICLTFIQIVALNKTQLKTP